MVHKRKANNKSRDAAKEAKGKGKRPTSGEEKELFVKLIPQSGRQLTHNLRLIRIGQCCFRVHISFSLSFAQFALGISISACPSTSIYVLENVRQHTAEWNEPKMQFRRLLFSLNMYSSLSL